MFKKLLSEHLILMLVCMFVLCISDIHNKAMSGFLKRETKKETDTKTELETKGLFILHFTYGETRRIRESHRTKVAL